MKQPFFTFFTLLAAGWALSLTALARPPVPSPTPTNEAACIAPYQFIELREQDTGAETDSYGSRSAILGAYERISPDGRFVLRSFSGRRLGDVALIELPAPGQSPQVRRTYATPLANEAFPVQGSWRYLVSPNGAHYRFADVLRQGRKAKPVFKGGMTGFYAAAAELPPEPEQAAGQVRIRSLSWPQGDGLHNQGVGALTARTITVDTQRNRIVADSGRQHVCAERSREDGTHYALPMISADGLAFAAMPQNPRQGQVSMRIYGFGPQGKGCELQQDFGFASGKAIFGRTRAEAQPHVAGADVAFEADGQIWWYSRLLQRAFALQPPLALIGETRGEWLPTAFPGLADDGRIIYGVSYQDCQHKPCRRRVGYIVADPYQLPEWQQVRQRIRRAGLPPACISPAAVQQARQHFAQQHGLSLD